MATPEKDTIYIDIDDEITGVIDKVKNSNSKVVCLVLPKRATVFQSIVNMKLLKRAADSNKKNVVLITSEAGLLPLAGAAGVHVAKSLTTKPEIPVAPKPIDDNDEPVDEDTPVEGDELESDKTLGELAGAAAAGAAAGKAFDDNDVETLTLDNEEPEASGTEEDSKEDKPKKDKNLKVPNFKRFRLAITIAVIVLLLLICGLIFADSSLDKATIDITTSETTVNTSLAITLSTSANSVDVATNTIPAKYVSQQKTYSQQVGTTGQKNEGNEASGTISSISAGSCSPTPPSDLPAGTGVSANSLTYITQDDITFQPKLIGGKCTYIGYDSSTNQNSVPIIAQSGGASYNVSGVPFTFAGNSGYSASGTTTGGTDNIVQTVNQNDINNAKSKINATDTSAVKQALESQLKGDGYYPIPATFSSGTPSVTSSANVGATASTVTVTETITYSMLGAYENDLNQLIDNYVDGQIDTSKQTVINSGLSSASFSINGTLTNTGGQVNMTTKSIAGPNINAAGIKQQVMGQKAGVIKAELSSNPNVTSVKVSFSPFWITTAPNNSNKITVNIDKNSSN